MYLPFGVCSSSSDCFNKSLYTLGPAHTSYSCEQEWETSEAHKELYVHSKLIIQGKETTTVIYLCFEQLGYKQET